MDDGVISEEDYRSVNALFDLATQVNTAVEEASKGLHNPTPSTGALLSRPIIEAAHFFEGNPTPYDKALGAISRSLDRLA